MGNKLDRESERKVDTKQAQQWCAENGDILHYETSAKEGVSVNDAFIEMAKMALKREANNQIIMPDSIGGASGAIKLQSGNSKRGQTNVEKKMCDC